MNILLITYGWDPRQADDGGQQRTHLLWKALGNIGNVYTLIISDAEMGDAVNIKCFNPYVEDKPYSCGKNILHRLKSFVGYVLFWKTGLSFCSYTERAEIADIFPGVHFDSIVCRYFKVLLYVNVYRIAPVYVDIDDYPLTLFDTLLCRQRKLSRIGCCFGGIS